MTRWVTIKKAAELTGLPDTFFDQRTGRSGRWPEGVVWKWFEGRKMIDSQALDEFIDGDSSPPSTRGRKKAAPAGASKEEQATAQPLPPFRAAPATYPAMPPVDPNARITSARSRHVPGFTTQYVQQYARDYLDLYRSGAGAPELPA